MLPNTYSELKHHLIVECVLKAISPPHMIPKSKQTQLFLMEHSSHHPYFHQNNASPTLILLRSWVWLQRSILFLYATVNNTPKGAIKKSPKNWQYNPAGHIALSCTRSACVALWDRWIMRSLIGQSQMRSGIWFHYKNHQQGEWKTSRGQPEEWESIFH